METLAAAWWLRRHAPDLRVRVVNVVDLMTLFAPEEHPHGMHPDAFVELFGTTTEVVFAFHGYAGDIHQVLHGRPNPSRFHVRGYREEGTTTTPFDMVVLNRISRFHLAAEALRRTSRQVADGALLIERCGAMLKAHTAFVREHFEDMPEIRDWVWSAS
jgi:xylulose-5-phosphate/fructose-6-phosphate phosphoketolase